jgi:hypothetical protein
MSAVDLRQPELPGLQQSAALTRLAEVLWAQLDVVALWLTGSVALGTADAYSDIDLHVAVRPEALDAWREPHSFFAGLTIVGAHWTVMSFGDHGFLHHFVLQGGEIVDLYVQRSSGDPPPDHVLVLGCRDAGFAARLAAVIAAPASDPAPADPVLVRQAILDFWIASAKHAKVLFRGLDGIVQVGLSHERNVLLRLWSIEATGVDYAPRGATIHALTPMARAVASTMGPSALELLGAPLRNRVEIMSCIEANRDAVALSGRRLAVNVGFVYPTEIEDVLRRGWADFCRAQP